MRTLTLLATALAFAAPEARAEPPLATDDANIVDAGKCQVEGQWQRQRGSAREQGVEFGCGFRDWLEVTLGRASSRTTLLQAKAVLRQLDTNPQGLAIAFGTVRSDPFANLIGSLKLPGDRAVVHLNLGAVRDRRAGLTRATTGLSAEYMVDATVHLVAETTAVKGDRPAPLAGVRFYPVPEHVQFSVALGRRRSTMGFHWDF